MSRRIHDWNYTVYAVDEAGDILEVMAHANNFNVAHAAFNAARYERSWSLIQLREGGRIVRTAKTGGYSTETEEIAQVWVR